jgi:hypothetical protein
VLLSFAHGFQKVLSANTEKDKVSNANAMSNCNAKTVKIVQIESWAKAVEML